jgi:hypothetical protein
MSDSLGEFFRRFDEALANWEGEQSAPSLVEVVREARHKQPSGYAIVQAAVDWELTPSMPKGPNRDFDGVLVRRSVVLLRAAGLRMRGSDRFGLG